LTISGHTPLELAHGRRPPDLRNYETSSPEELTNDPLVEDKIDRIGRKLPLKSHLEARQAEDLRLDLAKHVRPSDGPFKSGDRVFFWDKDPSEIKDQGRWIRGKVVVHTQSMVTIQTNTGVHRINESKVRLDHDEWHDVPIPILDKEPEGEDEPARADGSNVNPAQAEAQPGQPSSSSPSSTGPLFSEAFWLVTDKGNIDFLEIFAGSQGLSYACYRSGLRVGQPIDKLEGIDLSFQEGRNYVWEIILRQKPKMFFLAPPCTPWSQMQNIND
jgi:hypothetical protein